MKAARVVLDCMKDMKNFSRVEFVETFNRMSNQTIDLFEKTLSVYQAASVPEAQRRMQDLIESSLTALRIDVHSALNTNAKIIADWKELSSGQRSETRTN